VLGILGLLDQGLERVFYLDVDAHHGDGVQDAFAQDNRVFTISIHEQGRWPYSGKMEDRAGGRARNLPVPAGFTITTDACRAYMAAHDLPDGLEEEIAKHVRGLEERVGKRFGDADDPLLVSVRSGAAISRNSHLPHIGWPSGVSRP